MIKPRILFQRKKIHATFFILFATFLQHLLGRLVHTCYAVKPDYATYFLKKNVV